MPNKMTILVVEDEQPLSDVIRKKLELNDFEVVTARSVEQALEYLGEIKTIKAVWLDHYLVGEQNGLDYVVRLKQEGSPWKEVPIFVISNTASPETMQSYLKLGVSKYYIKSNFRLDQIVTEVKELVEKQS